MDKRLQQLQELKSYTEGIDKELTMILQTLQWDRKHLLQSPLLVTCRYDSNHKVPPDKAEEHEKECFLQQNGYSKDDKLLPDPLDLESDTLVKLKKEDIEQIIANASRADPLFKKVVKKIIQRGDPPHLICIGCREAEPMSLERLQTSYSADERRAIHDAVVNAVPSCHDLTDLALISGGDEKSSKVILSRQAILAELRNMRRRRTKYRVAAKSRNYSDVLRDVIKTQMEHYNDGKSETEPKETVDRDNSQRDKHDDRRHSRPMSKDNEKDRYRYDGKIVPRPIQIKTEREDSTDRNYRDSKTERDYGRERSDRYERGGRDRRDRDNDRREHYDRSRERRNYEDEDRTQKYGEHSRKRRYDDEPREKPYYYDDSKDKRNNDERDKEHRTDKRSRRDHRHKEHQVKIEPGLEEEPNNHQEETSRDRKHDEKRDKTHKHNDKKERLRDRERSREIRRDNRYEERSSERIHIKQEREDSVTRHGTGNYEREKADRKQKSKSRRHDRPHRDEHYDDHGRAPEEIYDPNKKIKEEKFYC